MTGSDTLALIAGFVLSLLFSYIPGLNEKFAALTPTKKRLCMAALLMISAVGLFALACGSALESLWPGLGVVCTQAGAWSLARIFILSLIANQGTYSISPQTTAVTKIAAKSSKAASAVAVTKAK
jgi:hypothetical protein